VRSLEHFQEPATFRMASFWQMRIAGAPRLFLDLADLDLEDAALGAAAIAWCILSGSLHSTK
jgi:hypothetical protein